ncbi:MAG TPA: hypothetical protein VHV52_05910 [Gaiellaceae bacterium]|nr:hypothetical protein [Gaiellaceae bacterium]
MKRRLWIGVLAAVLVVLPAAAHAADARTSSNSQTYPGGPATDPQAPHISSMVVSNDNQRNLTFKINISNRPQLTSDMLIICWFNADEKTSTGDTKANEGIPGGDYAIQLVPGEVDLFKWNGTDYVSGTPQSTLTYSYNSKGATIRINASELGGTKGFGFACAAVSGIATDPNGNPDFTNDHTDTIPGNGAVLRYTVKAPLLLTSAGFATTSSAAAAGTQFAASLAATESDTNGPVKGAVTCVGRVGKLRVLATHRLTNGVASCFWSLPKSAKGGTLRASVTITTQGVSLTKSFAVRVR